MIILKGFRFASEFKKRHFKRCWILLQFGGIFTLILLVWIYYLPGETLQQLHPNLQIFNPTKSIVKPLEFTTNLPIVLLWDNLGDEGNITCGEVQCHVTHNRDVIHHYDVLGILFYGSFFATNGLPLPRKPGHLWSVLHEESPKNNDWLFCAKDAMKLFNLTATFRRESHYPLTTMWLKNESDLTSTEYVVPLERKNQLRREGLAPIVFVHSDCYTPSDRSHYMRLLQQHIKIDSYGKCEHNKVKPDMSFKSDIGPMSSNSFHKFIAQYKFAFAFENAVCDDYVTEKLWRPLQLGVVPVAFGSTKIKELGPSRHSVISIRDFLEAKDLANYIETLDKNDTAYSEYMTFKQDGISSPTLRTLLRQRHWNQGRVWNVQYSGFQCYICKKLHDLNKSKKLVKRWSGENDHFECPKPMAFDDKGRYVERSANWEKGYNYAEYYLQSLRYHINNNLNNTHADIHKYARDLQDISRQ